MLYEPCASCSVLSVCIGFYRATQPCQRGLGSRPSVTRVLCDKTEQHTADILVPHDRAIVLVF